MTAEDVDRVLQQAARRPDGSYRVLASLALAGKPVGPFEYQGTRPDDPNDIVPHEHRRELRALRVFSAWLNHVDTKAENSLDTLVRVGPRTLVRHHLLDFGSTLGSGGTEPMQWRDGYEYAFDKRATVLALLSLGTYTPPWVRIRYPDLPSVGRIDGDHFQPDQWKPTLPNPAFLNARPDDTFWAAQRVMAFSDEAIHAVVATARFSDRAAAEYLSQALIKRRDQIGRTWLTAVNPIVEPSISRSGMLTFRNAAGVATAPQAYRARWSRFDNTTGLTTALGSWETVTDTQCAFPLNLADRAEHVMVEIRATDARYPTWDKPVRVYLARDFELGWSVIGLDRLPDVASPVNRQSAERQQSSRATQ